MMRSAAQLMLFYGLYILGFFRRFTERTALVPSGTIWLPLSALVLGSAGIVLGWTRLAPDVPWLRARLSWGLRAKGVAWHLPPPVLMSDEKDAIRGLARRVQRLEAIVRALASPERPRDLPRVPAPGRAQR